MRPISLQFVVGACAGELLCGSPDTRVRRVGTDSRQAQPDDLYVALEGDRFDGHSFLADVAAKGANAVVVNRSKAPLSLDRCAVIAVKNTRRALGQIAETYRREFTLPILAVGGSNGKTTAKELIASVLREKLNTLASPASFNNDIGVPLTLLRLDSSHEAAVLEVGTNHPGELLPLLKMIQPRYGVLTSIGREHLEFFGDLDGVIQEEGVLAEMLPRDGKLFINGDTIAADRIIARGPAASITVGMGERNDWRAKFLGMNEQGVKFRVAAPSRDFDGEYQIPLLGRHQVIHALLAAAIGAELGLSREEIQRGLASSQPAAMRLQLLTVGGVKLLNDAYNANADSTRAALETLRDLPCSGRRIAVLGDMTELGAFSEAAHSEAGRVAAELGIGHLYAVGKMAPVMGSAARAGGLEAVREFLDADEAAAAVKEFVQAGDVVLLKASRLTRLERVAEALLDQESAP